MPIRARISDALRRQRPLEALSRYEESLGTLNHDGLERQFGKTMSLIAAARDIHVTQSLRGLPQLHIDARRANRTRLLIATAQRLVDLKDDRATLQRIGDSLQGFVLEGTLQQQFCSKLAARMGLAGSIPPSVKADILHPLVRALITILRVGAPTTRDAAVEGLGAVLRILGGDAAALFPLETAPVEERAEDETAEEYEARVGISRKYFERLQRRRLIALTIAGHAGSRVEFEKRLEMKLDELVSQNRGGGLEDVLYERQDLLRFLPGIARQSKDPAFRPWTAELLREAAGLRDLRGDESLSIAISRFQESVFRTIDTAVRRGWEWNEFDEDIAAAVRAIPRTATGEPAVCNARIRATVAILRTAIHVVVVSDGKAHATTDAVAERFAQLRDSSLWSNHGIVEGCYRALPQLITDPIHDRLTTPAIEALFADLAVLPAPSDLLATHRRLVANSCFRRLLVSLIDVLEERQLFESQSKSQSDERRIDRDIRVILRAPAPKTLRDICQERHAAAPEETTNLEIDVKVIEGIVFESQLLHRSAAIFDGWHELSKAERVLLARILAAQLHAISRDAPEVARDDVLGPVFLDTPTASLRDDDAMPLVWNLLSVIPADAADALDAEIQRFSEYRGRQGRDTGDDDLPGYVLAMIAPMASSRIAGAIAREVDLNRRRDPEDFAKALYQVIMRGPHESIFDHLLPRVDDDEEDDRALVLLFRKYVARILHSDFDLKTILRYIKRLMRDLKDTTSPTLVRLREALALYRKLATNTSAVWQRIQNGDVLTLVARFDRLAAETDHTRDHRKDLLPIYERKLIELQREVGHYLSLSVSDFRGRIDVLTKAADIAEDIEKSLNAQRGLQPPERILLVTLMQQFARRFRRTIRWYCEEPRRRIAEDAKDERAKERFWLFFCDPRTLQERQEEAERRERRFGTDPWERAELRKQIETLKELRRENPPRFAGQLEQFEEFFVEWRAANLDVDSLKRVLHDRWPPWFQAMYGLVTSFWWTALLVLVPCAWAVAMDLAGAHWLEGLGFFVLSSAMLVVAVLSSTRLVHRVAKLLTRKKDKDEKRGYWFVAMLPRLARLTAVPMALIVEFDHSYEFPLNASTWVLLLLMFLSFLTTRFFVTREIVDRKEKPGVVNITDAEKKRVRQIVALALSHSFGIAVLLAAIFASSHEHEPKMDEAHGAQKHATQKHDAPASWWNIAVPFVRRLDKVPEEHHHTPFLGFVPRDVEFDVGVIAQGLHHPLPPEIAPHARFMFFPTIILTWTALGLFFGVFLEGFMKGARLRGGTRAEANAPE